MKRWHQALFLLIIILFSSCGILKKTRKVNHHGVETNDYDLPVIAYPSSNPASKRLMIIFSGDGGWLEFEDQLSTGFASQGFQTIGFNSRSYFWDGKTPQETADDVALLIDKYASLYKTRRIYLCGYSFGADVVPFIYNRLPAAIKNRVVLLELLSPFASSDFMVHTSDLLNIAGDDKPYKVQPEVEAVSIPVYCFYGQKEDPKPLEKINKKNFELKLVPGDHRYDASSYEDIFEAVHRVRRNPLFFRQYLFRQYNL